MSSAAGTGSCPADEMAARRLQCIFRIPLPHSALPGGPVPPCSSVRLFRQNSGLPMNTEEVFLCPFLRKGFKEDDMELKDTVKGMMSDDCKERMAAEYHQTKIRYEKLKKLNTRISRQK